MTSLGRDADRKVEDGIQSGWVQNGTSTPKDDGLVDSPLTLIPELCAHFYSLGWVSGKLA